MPLIEWYMYYVVGVDMDIPNTFLLSVVSRIIVNGKDVGGKELK